MQHQGTTTTQVHFASAYTYNVKPNIISYVDQPLFRYNSNETLQMPLYIDSRYWWILSLQSTKDKIQ